MGQVIFGVLAYGWVFWEWRHPEHRGTWWNPLAWLSIAAVGIAGSIVDHHWGLFAVSVLLAASVPTRRWWSKRRKRQRQ